MKGKVHLIISLGLLFLMLAWGICWSQTTERVSVDSAGGDSNGASTSPSISSDGRYVAFESFATDLVAGGTNGNGHIFVRDRQTDITTIVSVHSDGTEGDQDSSSPSISDDGRYVAFESQADNLIDGDTNLVPFSDILVHDLQTGITTLVSVDWTGSQGDGPSSSPAISGDGRYVAFESEADLVAGDTILFDIFVRDLQTGETTLVSADSAGNDANGNSYSPAISADGRYVAFESFATDLVAGGTNGNGHIFVRDRQTDITTIVSVHSDGTEGDQDSSSPSISDDGRYVAFESQADNLIDGDTNLVPFSDILVHDLQTGITTLISVDSNGIQGNGDNTSPSISADGRYVAFTSDASNLVDDDTNGRTDIFVHDLQTGTTTRVSVDSNGNQGNGNSSSSVISANGQYVTFESDADNLVGGDGNGFFDIFVFEGDPLPSNTTQSEENNSSANISCFIATAAGDWADF